MTSEFDDDVAFRAAVDGTLRALLDQIDEVESEDHDPQLSEGNLKIVFESGGTFVLSQQTPRHEIWLSANLSAWHFCRAKGEWRERDSDDRMLVVLSTLFTDKLGMDIRLSL